MSRSIVRSKINSKYNPVQTGGGGGGSAIAVYNEAALLTANVTSFTFTGLGIDATAAGNAVTVTVNNNEIIEVKNATVSTIPKGAVCYINVLGGSGTHPEILLASAATESASSKTIGVTADAIAPGAVGQLIINGEITGTGAAPLNTSAYNAGAMLWLSNTPGQWTTTIPSFPSHAVFIGHVTRSQTTNGRVVIKIQNGYEVQELHDAVINTKLHGQFLMVDTITYAPNTAWVNQRLVTQVTVSQLTALRNGVSLIPGMTYWITNAPVLFFSAVGTAFFFLKAISTDTLESCGTLEILVSGPPNSYRAVQCWYDLDTNTHPKISDPYNKNTIEGWSNIQNFMVIADTLGGIFDSSLKNNVIINSSTLVVPSNITNLSSFFNNQLDGATMIFSGSTNSIYYIEFNKLLNSTINLQATQVTRIIGNTLINSSMTDTAGVTTLQEFRYNYLENSNLSFTTAVPGLANVEYNRINHSTITIDDVSTFYYLSENFIDHSTINLFPGTTNLSAIIKNTIHQSILQFDDCLMQSFESNFLEDTTLSVVGSITGSGNIIHNKFNKSIISNINCALEYCNMFGMGVPSTAVLDTNVGYSNCNYTLSQDSTFYAYYDLDTTNIPASNYFTMPSGHDSWVGKLIFYSTLGGGPYLLKTIYNPIINHKYYIYMDESFSRFDMDTSSGFFIMPLSSAGLIKLSTKHDYMYVDGRPSPVGTQTGGEAVVIAYDNF